MADGSLAATVEAVTGAWITDGVLGAETSTSSGC